MKRYIIFAGVNGAGKTIFYNTNIAPSISEMIRINMDEIVRDFGSWDNPKDQYKVGMIAVSKIHECFQDGISFNQETTLCGKSILKNIHLAHRGSC